MKNQIYPCLWFDGKAKEAADFYCSVFKNSKIISDTPMVVEFEIWGKKMMGLNGGPMFKMNPSISMFALCETKDKTREIWSKLMEGGKALIDLDKQPWSELYGWVQDRYGMTWQIAVVMNKGDEEQITPSLLFTSKQFGRAEEAIKFYTSLFQNSSVKMMLPYPDEDPNAGKVMYSEFQLNGNDLIAMDGPGEHTFTFNEGVSLVAVCEDQKEIDFFWKKLTEGGEESMCGWLKDKFGISWQIIPAVLGKLMMDPKKAERVMQSVLKMRKLDIETMVNS